VPHEDLLPAAGRWARMLLANGQQAIRSAKETILEVIGLPLDDALRLEAVNGYSSGGDFREVADASWALSPRPPSSDKSSLTSAGARRRYAPVTIGMLLFP